MTDTFFTVSAQKYLEIRYEMFLNKVRVYIRTRLLSRYILSPFVVQQKAYVFAWITIVWTAVNFAAIFVNYAAKSIIVPFVPIIANSALFIFGIIALRFLHKGYLRFTVIASSFIFIASTVFFCIFQVGLSYPYGVNPAEYLFFPIIIFVGVFASIRFFIFCSGMIFLLHLILSLQLLINIPSAIFKHYYLSTLNNTIAFILVIILSYLSSRILSRSLEMTTNELERNKEFSRTLEDKVRTRTEDLENALDEITRTNESLAEARDALWGEMQIAKKMQTILLPDSAKFPGFKVITCFYPTTEVGGDYYDFIETDKGNWIIIGDVSGHGVPAGLVMMMVHSSIHSAVRREGSIPPSELLSHVNSVVSEYVNKVDPVKYMTISAFCHKGNGTFVYSGLHLPGLIYRAATKTVEEIDTAGRWIGFFPEVNQPFCDLEFHMEIGDTMILYTDGLIEAHTISEGIDGRTKYHFYSQEGVMKTLRETGDLPVEKILARIQSDLMPYFKFDDMCIVILKRDV